MLHAEVAELLVRRWELDDAAMTLLDGGMNSHTWLVRHRGTAYVAKLVAEKDRADLARGCEIAERLAAAGLVTGRPVPTCTGGLVAPDAPLALLEHVPGRELVGDTAGEQRLMGTTLAAVHLAGEPARATGHFFERWLTPDAEGVAKHPWIAPAIARVRAETVDLVLTWSLLHTDPAPEAFVQGADEGTVGLIDWTGAQRGPVLYDIASALMYVGGPARGAVFLDAYSSAGVIDDAELAHLDAFRRLRWAVQATYFAGRLAAHDHTGVGDPSANENGLADAARGLSDLGVRTELPWPES